MHFFIARHSGQAPNDLLNYLPLYRDRVPVQITREKSWTSQDKDFQVAFFQTPNSLFSDGSFETSDLGCTFFDGYIFPLDRDRSDRAIIRNIVVDLNNFDPDYVINRYSGEYAILNYSQNVRRLEAFIDPAGVCPLYFHKDPSGVASLFQTGSSSLQLT